MKTRRAFPVLNLSGRGRHAPRGSDKRKGGFCNSGRSKSRCWRAVRARFFTIRFFCRAGAETRKAGLSASSWEMQGGNSCGISLVFFVVRAGCKLRLVVHLFEERIDFFAAHGEDVVGFLVDDDFVRLAPIDIRADMEGRIIIAFPAPFEDSVEMADFQRRDEAVVACAGLLGVVVVVVLETL